MTKPLIIMPEEKLTEEQKEELLSDAFALERYKDSPIPHAEDKPIEAFAGRDAELLSTGKPELSEALITRGKMLGEKQGMTPRLPVEKHASETLEDASLDDVPPMRREIVLAEREARKKMG